MSSRGSHTTVRLVFGTVVGKAVGWVVDTGLLVCLCAAGWGAHASARMGKNVRMLGVYHSRMGSPHAESVANNTEATRVVNPMCSVARVSLVWW